MLIYLLVTNKIKSGEGIRWFTRKRIGDVALHAGASLHKPGRVEPRQLCEPPFFCLSIYLLLTSNDARMAPTLSDAHQTASAMQSTESQEET